MGKIVRIPKNANVVNAVPYIGVDLKDGRLTVIGAFFNGPLLFRRDDDNDEEEG